MVGPLVEETFFRGILLRKLSAINKFHALWFTSLLYAFAHLHEGLIVSSMCYSFALGYLLGWVMLKTNHLGYVTALHSGWNFLNYLIPILLSVIFN